MAAKITDLTAIDALAGADILEVVDDVAGTPTSKKATFTQVAAFTDAASGSLANKTITSAANTVQLAASAITSGTLALARGGLNTDVSALTGILKQAGGTVTAVTAPSGTIVGTSDTQSLTNKTVDTNDNTLTSNGAAQYDILLHNGTKYVRQAKGSNSTVLVTDASGVVQYATILNAMVNASAAIDGTKISPDFGSQNVTTTGNLLRTSSLTIASTDATNLYLGSTTSNTNQFATTRIVGNSAVTLQINATTVFDISSSQINTRQPVAGSSSGSVPFRFAVSSITKSDATDLTLSASQYSCPILAVGGTPGGNFNIIGPNTSGALFWITNSTANTLTIKKSGGTGIAIATGKSAMVRHDGTDYIRMTLDA